MENKVKLILTVITISALFMGGVYLRVENLLFADKLDQMEVQIKNQVSSLVLAYQADAKFLKKWVYALGDEATKRINWNSMSPYFALAQLNSKLQVVEWSFREKSPVSNLSKENLTQLINSFHVKVTDKEIRYIVYTDPDRKKIFLTLLPHAEKLWVFVSQGENLQAIMDAQKASPYMLTLINSDFLSLAHIKSEYVGQKIFENKVISEIKNSSKATTSGSFKISTGEEFFAFYEKIPEMDMYIYSQASLSELQNNKKSIKNQFVLFSMGFLIILGSLILLLLHSKEKTPGSFVVTKSTPPPAVLADNKNPREADENPEKNRLDGLMKMASVIGHEIKSPIIKVLNLATAGLNPSANSPDKNILKEIQAEIRVAKEIIDKLLVFSGDKQTDKIETKIEAPLLRALKNLEPQFAMKSIKVEKDFQELQKLPVDVIKMTTVFENILKNSIQSMERKADKLISLKSYSKDNKICVEISDNGEGIESDSLGKIFDPFYTTLNQNKNIGLGLSVSLGIVKNHDGKIMVESEKGKGTKIILELPLKPSESVQSLESNSEAPVIETKDLAELKIPLIDGDDIMIKMSESKDDTSNQGQTDQESENQSPSSENVTNKKILGEEDSKLNLSTTVSTLKLPNLKINVDELFKMDEAPANGEAAKDLKPENKNSKNHETVTQFIVPPKNLPKVLGSKESDNFKVLIRKPKGRS